ncbi:MAG: DNA polymerase III subunit beta, partial [Chloroflexi bacterium]
MELIVRTQALNLQAGRSEANIKGIDAQEFPIVPVPEGEGGIPIEPDVLRTAIEQVAFAAATDESRPILTGVLAKFEDSQL